MCQDCTHDPRSHCTHYAPVGLLWKGEYCPFYWVIITMCGLDIDDQPSAIPGHKQCMVKPNQWIIPFNIINGLTRMPMQPPTDDELDNLPHVIITSDDTWDPTVLDHSIDISNDTYHHVMDSNINEEEFTSLDECTSASGSYLHHDDYGPDYVCDVYHNEHVTCFGFDLNTTDNSYNLSPQCMLRDQDYEVLQPYLLWLPIETIKHNLATTTQWFHNVYASLSINI